MRSTLAALTLLALLAVPGLADAKKPKPIFRITGDEVKELVSADGQVEVQTDSFGDPVVLVTGRLNYIVQFYGCDKEGCTSIQFRAAWNREEPWDAAKLFQYAYDNRNGRVYIDPDGDLILETLVPLDGGVLPAHVVGRLEVFKSSSDLFIRAMAGG